jgi:hypothetical protein
MIQRADVTRDHTFGASCRESVLRGCAGALCFLMLACAAPAVRDPIGAEASKQGNGAVREPDSGSGGEQAASPAIAPERTDAAAQQNRPDANANANANPTDHPVDKFGYAMVGDDDYPPLYQRVEAVACTDINQLPGQCSTDDDCGAGFACLCGFLQGLGGATGGQCVPAQCRSATDCKGGRCLLSLGNPPKNCCTYGHLGFFCSRSASTCRQGGDCTGNGSACLYDDGLDRFECKPFGCQCG